jgi:phytoene synthase
VDAAALSALVRAADPDRWLTGLFVPEPARAHLHALWAFEAEIARVREQVSGPMPGEIRLQWWRGALEGARPGEAAGNPVAAALLASLEACRWPRRVLLDAIEARRFDLYDDPMPTLNDLEGYCGETVSAPIQLAAIALAGGEDPRSHEAAGHAGVAIGVTRIIRALPVQARRGQCFVPIDMLAKHGSSREDVVNGRATPGLAAALAELRAVARAHLATAEAEIARLAVAVRPAFLPLALVEPTLRRLDRAEPFGRPVELPQWRVQWLIWRAARRWSR